MKKVDELIDTLCDYITQLAKEEKRDTTMKVAENTKALAELVAARASVLKWAPEDSNGNHQL